MAPLPIVPGGPAIVRYRMTLRTGPRPGDTLVLPSGTAVTVRAIDRGVVRVILPDGRVYPLRRSALRHPEDPR